MMANRYSPGLQDAGRIVLQILGMDTLSIEGRIAVAAEARHATGRLLQIPHGYDDETFRAVIELLSRDPSVSPQS